MFGCLRSSYSLMWSLSAALLMGAAMPLHAQDVPDLRLGNDDPDTIAVEEAVAPPVKISTGAEDVATPVKRRKAESDPYAAPGVDMGAFRLFPSIEIGGVATSNVSRVPSGKTSDIGLRLRPELKIESDWVRHQLTANASFEALRYNDKSDLSTTEGSADALLKLDVRHTTSADLAVKYDASSTGLENREIPATAKGTRLDQTLTVSTAVTHDFGGIDGQVKLGLTRRTFGDVELNGGGSEDNSDRNYNEAEVALRAGLNSGAVVRPYVEAAYVPRFHDKSSDRNGNRRNSQGLRVAAGVTFDDDIWSGDVAATLELRRFEDDSLGSAALPGVVANVTWRPTDLTRFEFSSGASIGETIAANQSSTQNWNAAVTMTHALRDNVDLIAGSGLALERYAGNSDVTTTALLGANWTMNPFLVWGARYEGTWFNGEAAGSDYTDHRLLASIILRQ